jgi:YidC/Oxa1 family membrane protein insertase
LRQEEDIEESRRKTNINFLQKSSGSHDDLSLTSSSDNAEIKEPLKWVSFSQRFFTSALIAAK